MKAMIPDSTNASASGANPPQEDPLLRSEGSTGRDRSVQFLFDGETVAARGGQSVAAALLAAGQRILRRTSRRREPRGLFCGMGVCFECLVQINGRPGLRACRTAVTDGMRVETQLGSGTWEAPA